MPSAVLMRRLIFLFIFMALWWAQTSKAESVITVEVNESGNAHWIMEKRVPLTTPEINEWDGFLKKGQNISRYTDIEEFKDYMDLFTSSAQNFSNRSMKIEKFNISYQTVKTLSGGFGVIRYSFWWMNFSRMDSGKIYVGDAFPAGLILPPDNEFVVIIPDTYNIENATPMYDTRDTDRNLLIWEGTLYQRFGKGEPALVFSHTIAAQVPSNTFPWIFIISASVLIIACAFAISWKIRRSPKHANRTGIKDRVQINKNGSDSAHIIDDLAPLPDLSEELLGDEEKIEQYLLSSGGQAYQSDIVRVIGVSKSKISIVLAKMKEERRILKIKKGKENLIRLVEKKS